MEHQTKLILKRYLFFNLHIFLKLFNIMCIFCQRGSSEMRECKRSVLRAYHMTSVWSQPKYFPKDSLALFCVNHQVWPSTFLMLRPPIHPQAQIILGKYHKREDFRIEVRLPSSSTNWEKESPCIWKNLISTCCQTNLQWGCLTLMTNSLYTGNLWRRHYLAIWVKSSLKGLMIFYLYFWISKALLLVLTKLLLLLQKHILKLLWTFQVKSLLYLICIMKWLQQMFQNHKNKRRRSFQNATFPLQYPWVSGGMTSWEYPRGVYKNFQDVSISNAASASGQGVTCSWTGLGSAAGRRTTATPNRPPRPLINNSTRQTEAHQSTYTLLTPGRGQRSMERYRQIKKDRRKTRREEKAGEGGRRGYIVRASNSAG